MVFNPDDQSNVIVGGEVEVEGQVVTGAAAAEREQRPQITMSPQFTWQGLHQKSNYCFARGEAATEITLFVALIKGLPTPRAWQFGVRVLAHILLTSIHLFHFLVKYLLIPVFLYFTCCTSTLDQ